MLPLRHIANAKIGVLNEKRFTKTLPIRETYVFLRENYSLTAQQVDKRTQYGLWNLYGNVIAQIVEKKERALDGVNAEDAFKVDNIPPSQAHHSFYFVWAVFRNGCLNFREAEGHHEAGASGILHIGVVIVGLEKKYTVEV